MLSKAVQQGEQDKNYTWNLFRPQGMLPCPLPPASCVSSACSVRDHQRTLAPFSFSPTRLEKKITSQFNLHVFDN